MKMEIIKDAKFGATFKTDTRTMPMVTQALRDECEARFGPNGAAAISKAAGLESDTVNAANACQVAFALGYAAASGRTSPACDSVSPAFVSTGSHLGDYKQKCAANGETPNAGLVKLYSELDAKKSAPAQEPKVTFPAIVQGLVAKGLTKAQAVTAAVKVAPQIHAEWLAQGGSPL